MFHSSLVIWSSVDYQTAYGLRIGAVTPPNQYCEAFSASGKAVPGPWPARLNADADVSSLAPSGWNFIRKCYDYPRFNRTSFSQVNKVRLFKGRGGAVGYKRYLSVHQRHTFQNISKSLKFHNLRIQKIIL